MASYEGKFAAFIQICNSAKGKGADRVVVSSRQVLGDDYEELIESLNRLLCWLFSLSARTTGTDRPR